MISTHTHSQMYTALLMQTKRLPDRLQEALAVAKWDTRSENAISFYYGDERLCYCWVSCITIVFERINFMTEEVTAKS